MFIHRIKAWQLFAFWSAAGLLLVLGIYYFPAWFVTVVPAEIIVPALFAAVFAGKVVEVYWQWSIGYGLHKKLVAISPLQHWLFVLSITGAVTSLLALCVPLTRLVLSDFSSHSPTEYVDQISRIFPTASLIYLGLYLYISWYCGTVVQGIKSNAKPELSKHIGYSLLMLLPIIGVWFIQPIVNRSTKTPPFNPDVLDAD